MSGGSRLNAWWQNVELPHDFVEVFAVAFDNFHWLELLESGLLRDLILTVVAITLKVTDVGDVSHIPDLVTDMTQVSRYDVERKERPCIPEMHIVIYGWTADIHADSAWVDGRELLFLSSK